MFFHDRALPPTTAQDVTDLLFETGRAVQIVPAQINHLP
jgi:hypothetical protein